MGSKRFTSLDDYQRHGMNLELACRCGHKGVVDRHAVWHWFFAHNWPRSMQVALPRFRCSKCGQKAIRRVTPTEEAPTFERWGPRDQATYSRLLRRLR